MCCGIMQFTQFVPRRSVGVQLRLQTSPAVHPSLFGYRWRGAAVTERSCRTVTVTVTVVIVAASHRVRRLPAAPAPTL